MRAPHLLHIPYTKWKRRFLAAKLGLGLYYEPNIKIRSTVTGKYEVMDHCISEILPWLYIVVKTHRGFLKKFVIKPDIFYAILEWVYGEI